MDIVTLYLYAFLIGSIPTAFLIGKIVKGIDIREYGSGNVGGTNVYYHVGKVWLVPLGIFDLFVKDHHLFGLECIYLIWTGHLYIWRWLVGVP